MTTRVVVIEMEDRMWRFMFLITLVCVEYLPPSPGGVVATPALRPARFGSCDQAERSACEDSLESPPLPSNEQRLETAC